MKKNFLLLILMLMFFYGYSQNCDYDKWSDKNIKRITMPFKITLLGGETSTIKFVKIDTVYYLYFTYIMQDYKALVLGKDDPINVTLFDGTTFILKPVRIASGDMDENAQNDNKGRTIIKIPTNIPLHQLKMLAAVGLKSFSFTTSTGYSVEEENKNKGLNKNIMKAANCIMQ